ncbi:hypothetical protein ACLBYG_22275 [Methylobacterium sp. D53M]
MTPAQYATQGALARAIIDHDRQTAAEADEIAGQTVIDIGWGAYLRHRRARRAELSTAAGNICNRPAAPDPTRPLAASGTRR